MIKKCKICGTIFESKSNRACYCSDECRKEGRKAINHKKYLKRKSEGYDYNKWNKEKLEDAHEQFNEINDGYHSSLRINEKRELTEAYGSKEAEKESYKYNTKSKQCKKEWEKAEEQLTPLF